MKISTRYLALLAVAGACAIAAVAEARLPTTETTMLEHAVNDFQYGDVLADQLDGIVSETIAYGGKTVNSNNTIVVTAKRPIRLRTHVVGSATYASFAVPFYLGTTDCQSVTATAATTLSGGVIGGYIPTVTGKAGWLLLNSNGTATLNVMHAPSVTYTACTILPNGKVNAGAAFSF